MDTVLFPLEALIGNALGGDAEVIVGEVELALPSFIEPTDATVESEVVRSLGICDFVAGVHAGLGYKALAFDFAPRADRIVAGLSVGRSSASLPEAGTMPSAATEGTPLLASNGIVDSARGPRGPRPLCPVF